MTIAKISPSRDSLRRVYFDIKKAGSNEDSYPASIIEIANGNKVSGHKGRAFLKGKEGGNRWLEISAPLRAVSSNGEYQYEPRRNADGKFIDDMANVVDRESLAGRQPSYVKDVEGKTKYGLVATVNVVNNKKDKKTGQTVPTKSTYLSVKIYSESESYEMAKTLHEYQLSDCENEKSELIEIMNTQKKEMGTYSNMFVDSGAELFQEMGFEFRSNRLNNEYCG